MRDYTECYYLPAATAYRRRAAADGLLAAGIVQWQQALAQRWSGARFGTLEVEIAADDQVFRLPVYFGELDQQAVRVELYADAGQDAGLVRQAMTRGEPLAGATNGYAFSARLPAVRPPTDYTPRLIPHHPEAAVPLEAGHILWQR